MSLYVELRDKYLKGHAEGMAEGISQGMAQGISRGILQGEERINHLNIKLIESGRSDDIMRAATDRQFREKLLKELKI